MNGIRITRHLTITLLLVSASLDCRAATPTIAELQRGYVGQRVFVNYSLVPCWHKTGQIVSLQSLVDQVPTRINAMGELVPERTPQSSLRLELRCDDGTAVTRDLSVATFIADFEKIAPPLTDAERSALKQKLESYVGKTLYALEGSVFYPATATIADLQEGNPRQDVVVLQIWPLRVKAWKIWDAPRGAKIILQLNSPIGDIFWTDYARGPDGRVLENPIAWKLASLPPTCWVPGSGPKDAIAIGETAKFVRCAWGSPEKVNDYGIGGEQWIYRQEGAEVFVYLRHDVVTDIQRFPR